MSRRPRTWPSRPAVAAIAILATLVPFAGIMGAAPSDTGAAVALDEAMRRGSERYPLDIPSQPVGKALILFGKQTGLSVIVQHDAREVVTNAVAGTHTVPEGLRLLVHGTNLDYRYQDRGVVVSRKPKDLSAVSRLSTPNESLSGDIVAPAEPRQPSAIGADESETPGTKQLPEVVVVTGSRIGLAPSQVSSHMVVVEGTHLADSGVPSVLLGDLPQNTRHTPLDVSTDLLATQAKSLGGTTFLPGCDHLKWGVDQQQLEHLKGAVPTNVPMNLRGLGSRGTLLLVDGKRIGRTGLLGGYTDISSIPAEMVERVEIQLDGASALYGSDAFGGVVNIILRDDYEGTTVKLRRTTGLAGAYGGIHALVAGTNAWSSGRLTGLLGNYTTKNRILTHDPARDFLDRANPSFANDPLLGESGRSASRQRTHLRLALVQHLGGNMDVSASFAYVPGHTSNTVEQRWATSDPLHDDLALPLAHLRQLGMAQLPAITTEGETDRWTFSASVDGFFDAMPGWEWHFGVDHTREYTNSTTSRELSLEAVRTALIDGSYKRLANVPPEDRLQPFLLSAQTFEARNEDLLVELYAKRSFAVLPAGKLNVLLGVSALNSELRFAHERDPFARHVPVVAPDALGLFPIHPGSKLVAAANPLGIDGVVGSDPTGGAPTPETTTRSMFAELQIPLLSERPLVEKLSVNGAVRRELTPLYGANATWSVGAVWKINDDLRVRLRKGTSFSAPPIWLSSRPTETAPIDVFFDERCDSSNAACSRTCICDATIVTGGRSSLLPESATSWSYGIEYTPSQLAGFRTILNYSKTELDNRIDGITPLALSLIPRLTDDLFDRYDAVYRFGEDGEFLGLDARATNIGSLLVATYDFSADYQRETAWGTWSLGANVTMYDRYESRLGPREVLEDLVGLPHAVPRFRQHARLGWVRGNLSAALNASHRDDADKRYRAIDSRVSLKYPVVLDFMVAYRLGNDAFGPMKNVRVNLGVSNLAKGHTRWVESSWNPTGYQSRSTSYTEVTSPWTERAYFLELVHTF